jgi:uncharacterized protein (UPF0548 family)
MAVAQATGDKRGVAYGLLDVAHVLTAQDRLVDARAAAEQSIALRQEIKSAVGIAEDRLQLAEIALEQGKFGEAESLARAATQVFDKQIALGDGSQSFAVLAQALMAEGKTREARIAVERASSLSRQSGDVTAHFAAILARQATQSGSGKSDATERALEGMLEESRRHGFTRYELEARLDLGKLELRRGKAALGQARLQSLQEEAHARGFLLISRKAATALGIHKPATT